MEARSVQRRMQVKRICTFDCQERERGFFFPGGAHPMPELIYVDRGTLHSVADGQELLLEPGEMTIYSPGQWHMQYADVDVAPRFVTISFDLAGEGTDGLFGRKFRAHQRAEELLRQMCGEQEHPDAYSDDMVISLLTQLLLVLLREGDSLVKVNLRTGSAARNEDEIILRAQQYIAAHIRERLNVPIVARHADVSPSYLTALFRKSLCLSPGEYIRRVKLEESRQMIREGELNFTEIAAALEYSTVHHFSRQFKEKFGITPTEYARSIR